MTAPTKDWDHEYDVVVVGSGAGGMTAALCCHDKGLKTLLIEKDNVYGGTSAVSGGGIWIPGNDQAEKHGCKDREEDWRKYVHALTEGDVDPKRVDAYLDNGPEMVRYLEKRFDVHYDLVVRYPDYFMKTPGALAGWRSMEPAVFDASKLGDELDNQRESYPGTLIANRIAMSQAQANTLLTKKKGWVGMFMKLALLYLFDFPWRFKTKRDRRQKLGQAMVGSLRYAMLKNDVPLWLNTGLEELIQENGRVVGVKTLCQGDETTIRARRGVILACGGFEANQEMREKYLPKPTYTEWSAGPGCNHGDGIQAGMELGARVKQMDGVWGGPVVVSPVGNPATVLFVERALPRSIIVNGNGQRYMNEAGAYTDVVYKMLRNQAETGVAVPSWFIADAVYRKDFPMGPVLPGSMQPDFMLPKGWDGTVFHKANSLEELAEKAEIDADTLKATIARYNEMVVTKNADEDFGKGDNDFDTYYGDARLKTNPCLGPIEKPPFYAVRIHPGELGTNGGLDADERGRVQKEEGGVIPGLYAIGNCSAAVMGRSYPGAGSTLGPAMVYGYIAAQDIAAQAADNGAAISDAA